MYLLLILAMSVMAGATLVRAAKACFEGVWLERWKSAATPGYASRCGLHHVQTFGERIRVLHSSDGRALPYRSQDRLRKNVHRRSDGAVHEHFVDPLLGGGGKGGSRATRRRRQEADVQKQLTSITAALATLQAQVNGKGAGKTRGKAKEGAPREKEKGKNSEGDILIIARIRALLKIVDAGQKVTHASASSRKYCARQVRKRFKILQTQEKHNRRRRKLQRAPGRDCGKNLGENSRLLQLQACRQAWMRPLKS